MKLIPVLLLIYMVTGLTAQSGSLPAPSVPQVYATVEHNRVILSWSSEAITSVDSVTGYADFEGYRIYRSTDGGENWGPATNKIYDYDGTFVGWRPYAQFDLSAEEDEGFCLYEPYACSSTDPVRGLEISGPDPLAPWFNIGENTGIRVSYVDEDVVDGRQYTYTVTAFDMGLRTFTLEYSDLDGDSIFVVDTVWSDSNPDHIVGPDGGGVASMECPRGSSADDINFITVISGYYASNITFPDNENVDQFLVPQEGTIGTGGKYYEIVDPDELTGTLVRFEIQAELEDEAYEYMACANPEIYVYEIDDTLNQEPSTPGASYTISSLSTEEIDFYSGLPGAQITASTIDLPDYELIAPVNFISDLFNGIRVQFNNIDEQMPVYTQLVETSWYASDTVTGEISWITMQYSDALVYRNRPNFDYRIDFFSSPAGDTMAFSPLCASYPIVLPFTVTNLTTGKKVRLLHNDYGYNGTFPPVYDEGGWDCTWTINEEILLYGDTLIVNGVPEEVYTFRLRVNYNTERLMADYIVKHGIVGFSNAWSIENSYMEDDITIHRGMVYYAASTNSGVEPTVEFIDTNNDGINENPWRILYPWQDGDYLIINPQKFFTDGDSWVADMSQLGASHPTTQEELEGIEVVPNPYLVRSDFNETENDRKLRFIKLPLQCRISIYTITGELVDTIIQNEIYDGNAWWDLRTASGELVAPGLYIYVAESNGKEHIGKFAVVR